MADNIDNMNYLEEALAKNYDTVLIGYGNSMAGNKRLREEKMKLDLLLQNC